MKRYSTALFQKPNYRSNSKSVVSTWRLPHCILRLQSCPERRPEEQLYGLRITKIDKNCSMTELKPKSEDTLVPCTLVLDKLLTGGTP